MSADNEDDFFRGLFWATVLCAPFWGLILAYVYVQLS